MIDAEGIDLEPVVLAVVDDLSDSVDEVVLLVFADDVFGAVVLLFVVDDLTLAVDLAVVFALDDVADELVLFCDFVCVFELSETLDVALEEFLEERSVSYINLHKSAFAFAMSFITRTIF